MQKLRAFQRADVQAALEPQRPLAYSTLLWLRSMNNDEWQSLNDKRMSKLE
jgi:hypothetical protein